MMAYTYLFQVGGCMLFQRQHFRVGNRLATDQEHDLSQTCNCQQYLIRELTQPASLDGHVFPNDVLGVNGTTSCSMQAGAIESLDINASPASLPWIHIPKDLGRRLDHVGYLHSPQGSLQFVA